MKTRPPTYAQFFVRWATPAQESPLRQVPIKTSNLKAECGRSLVIPFDIHCPTYYLVITMHNRLIKVWTSYSQNTYLIIILDNNRNAFKTIQLFCIQNGNVNFYLIQTKVSANNQNGNAYTRYRYNIICSGKVQCVSFRCKHLQCTCTTREVQHCH